MTERYVENFASPEDIISNYRAPADALEGAEVLLAWYGYGNYDGSSLVVFRRDGKLYEVNGGHCSCYGLEGQWDPEETSLEALEKRADAMIGQKYTDGEDEAGKALKAAIAEIRACP